MVHTDILIRDVILVSHMILDTIMQKWQLSKGKECKLNEIDKLEDHHLSHLDLRKMSEEEERWNEMDILVLK